MKNKLVVSIIGTVGIPARYGGFETLVEYLTYNLNGSFKFEVYCSSIAYRKKIKYHNNSKLCYVPLKANGFQSVFYDIVSMLFAFFRTDIFLILGVSGCIFLPFLRIFSKKKIIVNIDGLEWKRDKWNCIAKKFLKFSEFFAVKYAHHIVADNAAIARYVKDEYGVDSHTISYGADHVCHLPLSENTINFYPFVNSKYFFKVCRIEPENNIEMILMSFSNLSDNILVIVGNWSSSEFGINLKQKYSPLRNLYLLDPIYDQNILDQLRSNCFCYIHGHSAGGTNPSLVEAMYLGLPVISYDVDYNRCTTLNKALYFNNCMDLINLINKTPDDVLSSIGLSMQSHAESNYIWKNISSKYAKLFYL